MSAIPTIIPPEGEREARRFGDYFNRMGVTKKSVLESVALTYARSNVYFNDVYTWMAESGSFEIACSKGCSFCCHTLVSVLPPEAFYLADQIEKASSGEELRAIKNRVIAHDAEHRGKAGAERYEGHIACSFLDPDTKLCRVHENRPLTCRSMHSSDVSACQKAFDARDAYISTPSHALFFANSEAYYQAFGTALRDHNVQMAPLELNAALATIWTQKNVLIRWLAGEQPFAGALAV